MPSNGKDLILVAKIVKDGIKRDDVIEIMDVGTCTPKYQQLLVYSKTLVMIFNDAVEMELAKMLLELKSKDQSIFESITLRRDDADSVKFEIIEARQPRLKWFCCSCFIAASNKSSSSNYLF